MSQDVFSRPGHRPAGDPALRARDEKLESLKAVVGKLAHDFNNFLVPQFGYLTLLKEELSPNTTSAEYAARMESAGRKTEGYIESILLGMRPHRQFAPAAFSFSAMVESILDEWKSAIPAGTQIEVCREIEPCDIVGDERQWRSAVGHLLSNVRYALATGGRLETILKRVVLDASEITRLGLESEDVYQLVIRDTGFGMPAAVAARAFEPFFTTRTQIKAAGLGLTIAHAVTQFHGGQVELQSVEDQGTTLTLWIPVNGVTARNKLSPRLGTASQAAQKRRVLLVESDPLINEVLRDWLGRFGFEVHVATNAEEALKLFQRKGAEWSLVIIEADLQGIRGEDIFTQLSALNANPAWIFLAGRGTPEFASKAAGDSASPLVIQKPVTLRAFGEVVQGLLGK